MLDEDVLTALGVFTILQVSKCNTMNIMRLKIF